MLIDNHKVKSRNIEEITVKGRNIIRPWGFETADTASFFNLGSNGYRYKTIEEHIANSDGKIKYESVVSMHDGKWRLNIEEEIGREHVKREHTITTLEDSYLMDFVSRFQFRKEFFKKASIAGKEITHNKTNIYYQYPTDKVELIGEEIKATIKVTDHDGAGKLNLYMYVSGYEDVWIIHARLLPEIPDKEVIKVCHPSYNKAIPEMISNPLLKIKALREYLWYRRERKQPRFPISAYGLSKIEKNHRIMLKTEVTFA